MTDPKTGITRRFDQPFYAGTTASVTQSATTPFDIVLNGRGYLIELNYPPAGPYKVESIPLLAAMFLQDRSTQPIGEHSLNSHDYWRRSVDDWLAGAGQKYLDLSDSVGNQFHASKGIDPWTQGQISMLPDTAKRITSSNTNLNLAVAGTYLYVLDGNTLKYTQDITTSPSLTTVTAAVGTLSSPTDLTTDGYTVWACDGTRVYYTPRAGATYAKYHTSDHVATLVHSTKGRLFTANANIISTHSGAAGSATATAYFTHPNSDFTWVGIAGGPDSIYFAGYSGDKSTIYAATIRSDGTALDVPVAVATLPYGEIVRSIKQYLSVLVIGTDKGFRIASIAAQSGSLILGSLVAMSMAPRCFDPQDRFVWFGWSNYDSTSTGLGRIDLSTFNGDIPAYASDLMATAQGNVLAVSTFQSIRVFAVSGSGIWAQTTDKVASASITSGWLNYALADPKVAIKLNVQYRIGAGTIQPALAVDDQTTVATGASITTSAAAGNSINVALPQTVGRAYELTFTLTRSGTDSTTGPIVDRFTLMVEPQPERRRQWTIPLRLHAQEIDRLGANRRYDPSVEYQLFVDLMRSRQVIPLQDYDSTTNVIIDDVNSIPYNQVGNQRNWDRTVVIVAKEIN